MPEDATRKLDLRLVPAEGDPDPALLDDLVRLIRQGVVTAPKDAPDVGTAGDFRPPPGNSQNALEARIKNRIEQASVASQAAVETRSETAKQPDGEAKLAAESLEAARQVVAALQRAVLRGLAVRVPDPDPKPTG